MSDLLTDITGVLNAHQVYLACGCGWSIAQEDAPPDAPPRHKAEQVIPAITEYLS